MNYLRTARTRGDSVVRILVDEPDYVIGVYWSDSEMKKGWIPMRWSKHYPFVNGSTPSGLDLMELL